MNNRRVVIAGRKDITEAQKNAIVFLAKKVIPRDVYQDPFATDRGLDFLINQNDSVEKAIEDLDRGIHTIQRYCNIASRAIDEIKEDEGLGITAEAKKLCKQRYLAIAALAKREYRSDPAVYTRKRPTKKTFIFQKLREFEENQQLQFTENLDFQWDKESVKILQDKYNRLKRNFDAISTAQPGEPKFIDNFQLVDQLNRIDQNNNSGKSCVKGTAISYESKRGYRQKVLNFMKEFNQGKNLMHLIMDPKAYVIDKLESVSKSLSGTLDSLLNAIKFYLRCSNLLEEFKKNFKRNNILEAISIIEDHAKPKRKEYVIRDNQKRLKAKKDPYPFLIEHFGMFYTWGRFRHEVNRILTNDLEDNYTQRLIMSLYTDYIPRRSSDYVNMVVITKDIDTDTLPDVATDESQTPFNYLIFTRKNKKFIFNYWKNARKKGKQEFDIEESNIINSITKHLRSAEYKANTEKVTINGEEYKYLLYTMRDRKPLTKSSDMVQQLQHIRNRWDIPFSIRDIRHSFATWFIRLVKKNREQVKLIAWQMGTSENMLMNIYYDADVVQQLNMDSLDEFSDNPMKKDLDRMYDADLKYFRKYFARINMENDFLKDMDGDILSMNPKGSSKDNTQIPPPPPKPELESLVTRYFGNRQTPCTKSGGCKSIKTPQVPSKKK